MIRTTVILVILASVFVYGVRYMEKKSIFFPMKQMGNTPSSVGLRYRDVYFKTLDGKKIHAWFIPADKAGYTVLFSHGNAGNISHRLDKISMLNDLGVNVFIFDYRGYGESEGSPSEAGLYSDINAAYEYLAAEEGIEPLDIVLYGESIGGAVVIELARHKKTGGVITEGVFTSVKDMARMAFPMVPSFIFTNKLDSLAKVGEVMCPKLIMHSVDDEIVPFSHGERIFSSAKGNKKFIPLRGGHNTAFLDSKNEYIAGISDFIQGLDKRNVKGDIANGKQSGL